MIVSSRAKNVRQLATEILHKVDSQQAYADVLLDHHLRNAGLIDIDRALLTELVYGTLRWRAKIDARLVPFLNRSLIDTGSFNRNLLRVTVYQLLFLDKVPDYAAVNEAVEIVKTTQPKSAGFINAVLRNFLRHKDQRDGTKDSRDTPANLAEEYSHPQWLVDRWFKYFGEEQTKALMLASNQKAPLAARVNERTITRLELLARWHECGITACASVIAPQGVRLPAGVSIEALPGFAEGQFQIQSEASQLVSYLVGAKAGETILDACAAPGGKATHLAESMGDCGKIIAMDISTRGIEKITQNARRLGLDSLQVIHADASKALLENLAGPYDRILVDAPCSGFGTLRSHPEIKWQRNESDITRLAALQRRILQSIAPRLKNGGVLVYSTCTLTTDENEQIIEAFLRLNSQFELTEAAVYLPEPARHMVRHKYFQALPQRDDTDGFFAARMRKVA